MRPDRDRDRSAHASSAPASNERIVERNRDEGFIISCDGESAVIAAKGGATATGSEDYWAVGQMISVRVGKNRLVGFVHRVEARGNEWRSDDDNTLHVHIELVGEVRSLPDGGNSFSRGITTYPYMGAVAHRIRAIDLKAMYDPGRKSVRIGNLSQDISVEAMIDIERLLSRHFAVVGSTGVGKSTAVALLLDKIVVAKPDMRVLILDPHREFGAAFADNGISIDAKQLNLPYWMFRFEELVEVIYRGRQAPADERDALEDLIPEAKLRHMKKDGAERASEGVTFTADAPLPYRMTDVIYLITQRMGALDNKADRPHLRALRNRLQTLLDDPRFGFMFGARSMNDSMERTISQIFRLPIDGKPICVFEMTNLPVEIVNVVVSVLCRIAFDLGIASDGATETLVVCEEAHRYIPADTEAGFNPTRQSIARIAKEGRKYGVYLGIVTQRPSELDQTILSQCSTIFAMRLANQHDQDIIRRASVGAARSTLDFLASTSNRECIAFGEAFKTPMRMMFETVPPSKLPSAYQSTDKDVATDPAPVSVSELISRMRAFWTSKDEFTYELPASLQPGPDPEEEAEMERLRLAVLAQDDDEQEGADAAAETTVPEPDEDEIAVLRRQLEARNGRISAAAHPVETTGRPEDGPSAPRAELDSPADRRMTPRRTVKPPQFGAFGRR